MEDNMSKLESPSQGVDHDTTTVKPEEMSAGDHLSLWSFEKKDFQVKLKDFRNLVNLSLQSFNPEDFLSDGEPEDQEKRPLDEPLNGVMDGNTQDLLPSNSLPQVVEHLGAVFNLIHAPPSSDFTLKELDDLDKQTEDLDMASRALDRSEPSTSTTAVPAWYLQADKDLEAAYNIIEAASISEFTLEMLDEMEQEIKDLGVLMQFTTKNLGKGRKKAKAVREAWVEKKEKNMGKRFLQWLKRKMSCCSCVDVRW